MSLPVLPATDDPRAYGLQRYLARAFGVRLSGDIHERLLDKGLTLPLGRQRRRRLAAFRNIGMLFIHVPKNAGMSVSQAIYGLQVKHATFRYYQMIAPDLADGPSFAVIRDPAARFLSAYAYARAGGSADNIVSAPFRREYRSMRTIDQALDLLEAKKFPYDVDHIFRPQSWYLQDEAGRVGVRHLLGLAELDQWLRRVLEVSVPHINRGPPSRERLTSAQIARLRRLYPQDFDLFERFITGSLGSPAADGPDERRQERCGQRSLDQGVRTRSDEP